MDPWSIIAMDNRSVRLSIKVSFCRGAAKLLLPVVVEIQGLFVAVVENGPDLGMSK